MTEQDFWDWFIAHKSEVEPHLASKNTSKAMPFYNKLCEKLAEYNEVIIPEIGTKGMGNFELTLTADGVKKRIPFVEKLADSAPEIAGWRVLKFREPMSFTELEYQGLVFSEKEILVSAIKSPSSDIYHVSVYMKGYKSSDASRFQGAAFLYLDHAIGEYQVMTRINFKGCKKLDLMASTLNLYTLAQFAELLGVKQS